MKGPLWGRPAFFTQPTTAAGELFGRLVAIFAWLGLILLSPGLGARSTEENPRQGSRGEHLADNGGSRRSARWPARVLAKWALGLGKGQAMAARLAAGDFRGGLEP